MLFDEADASSHVIQKIGPVSKLRECLDSSLLCSTIWNILLPMVARSILARHLRSYHRPLAIPYHATRYITSQSSPKTRPRPSSSSGAPPAREKSWLTRKVESSPAAMKVFVKLTNALGYGSPKQLAGRRAFAFYEQVCAVKPDHDREFWQQGTV